MTKRARFQFAVKEYLHGDPWIAFEPTNEPPDGFPKSLFGFDLPEGTTLERAEQIADFMNSNLSDFTVTPL